MHFFAAALLACTGPTTDTTKTGTTPQDTGTSGPVDSGPTWVDSATPTADTGVSTPTADTSATTDTGIDLCATLPTTPASFTAISGIPTSEEIAFDAFGNLVNVSDNEDAMFRTPFGGPAQYIAPYSAIEVAGTRFLPDGDLALADEWEGAVVRLAPDGARQLMAGGLISPNSLAVRSTGDVYVGGYGEIVRIHTDGTIERIFEKANTDFDGLVLSPDETILWINHDDGGVVGQLLLDATGAYISASTVVTLAGSLDGAAMDVCGNYYVITVAGVLWRVSPTGTTQRLADMASVGASYTTAVRFGSGIGGWELDHVYIMDRSSNKIWDVDLGVEGAKQPHIP